MTLPQSEDSLSPDRLYSMSDEQIKGLADRLRNLVRNAGGEIQLSNYLIGEDTPTGYLTIDILWNTPGKPRRECFMSFNREGEVSVRTKFRTKVKGLDYQLVLEELARI